MKAHQLTFEAIGTQWNIDVVDSGDFSSFTSLEDGIKQRIETFDKTYSRFRDDSLVAHFAKHRGDFVLPEDAQELFDLYVKLYTVTDGLFTPLIGDVLVQAGYDASYSLQSHELQKPPTWQDALEYSFPHVKIKMPVVLDFGAGGKGYLVDLVSEVLDKNNVQTYTIDASGDILYKDSNQALFRIGLEHPDNEKEVIGVATITDGSLCGSAGNRRSWGNFHHIINPDSLASPSHILATWVVADKALIADSLATALFLTNPSTLAKHFEFEYVLLKPDFTIEKSDYFPGEFFYN